MDTVYVGPRGGLYDEAFCWWLGLELKRLRTREEVEGRYRWLPTSHLCGDCGGGGPGEAAGHRGREIMKGGGAE